MRSFLLAVSAVALIAAAAPAIGAELQVRLAKLGADGDELVFEPALSRIAVGDTVTFIPTDKSLNVESIAGMLPRGAARIESEPGRVVSVTFTVPGIYGLKSTSQYEQGMVGLVVVGDAKLAPAKTTHNPAAAQARLDAMISTLE